MNFPYLKLPSRDPKLKWIARPYIPIRLSGPKGGKEIYALIDSGADRSLFNIQLAEVLGLNLDKVTEEIFSGIEGGSLKAKLDKVKMQIVGMSEEIEILAGFITASPKPRTFSPGMKAKLGYSLPRFMSSEADVNLKYKKTADSQSAEVYRQRWCSGYFRSRRIL